MKEKSYKFTSTYVIIYNMSDVIYGRGCVYKIQYHIVWCVKYRHPVLIGDVECYTKQLLYKIAADNNIIINEINCNKDHIHLLILCSPQHYIPNIIKTMKGVSAILLFKEYGDTLRKKLWGEHLWNPSYFVATVSENTEQQIKQYIHSQKER